MENKIKAIEEQIEKLLGEKEKFSREEPKSKKKALQQKLTLELIDKVIGDLESRKAELSRTINTSENL
jgi:hypothetical protein